MAVQLEDGGASVFREKKKEIRERGKKKGAKVLAAIWVIF